MSIDATTLEANAAMRSIVRRDSGESYQEFLTGLAKASGIETPTREDLAKLDKNRRGKGWNKGWKQPHDPDAHFIKMKDGRTQLAHKAVYSVDMRSARWWALPDIRRHAADNANDMLKPAPAYAILRHGRGRLNN